MTTRDLLWAPALLAAACFCTHTLAQDQIVHHCWIDDHGRLTGTGPIVHHQDPSSLPLGLPTFDAVTLLDNGEAQGQIDLVFMGDGFTESELDAYRAKVVCTNSRAALVARNGSRSTALLATSDSGPAICSTNSCRRSAISRSYSRAAKTRFRSRLWVSTKA